MGSYFLKTTKNIKMKIEHQDKKVAGFARVLPRPSYSNFKEHLDCSRRTRAEGLSKGTWKSHPPQAKAV
jgi:hypothetical protein